MRGRGKNATRRVTVKAYDDPQSYTVDVFDTLVNIREEVDVGKDDAGAMGDPEEDFYGDFTKEKAAEHVQKMEAPSEGMKSFAYTVLETTKAAAQRIREAPICRQKIEELFGMR